jgi:hypothetical protein
MHNADMMEYMSSFPPPNKKNASEYIANVLYPEYEPYGINKDDIYIIATSEYDKFGSLGSQTAWLMETSHRLTENVRITLNKRFLHTKKISK